MSPLRADQIGPLDMFKIGIGPSSSHTVGPMLAALEFRNKSLAGDLSSHELALQVELYGSLSATGKGHSTDAAVCAGLAGLHPKTAAIEEIWAVMPHLKSSHTLPLGEHPVHFDPANDIIWGGWTIDGRPLPHPNTIRFVLRNQEHIVLAQTWLSVGGGFVETAQDFANRHSTAQQQQQPSQLPHPYNTAAEFIDQCTNSQLPPWQIVVRNEIARGNPEGDLRNRLSEILYTMFDCIERGLKTDGILPGGLNVRRRAKSLYAQMLAGSAPSWAAGDLRPSVYAMAVNEENAAGGRVVTAPTNGSSGLIPAVWRTLKEAENLTEQDLQNGLITASVIGALVKTHASISGAEVGCQGEVGTSCAMAAAGAVAMLGGTPYQIENAAEIGIEHHLGMTCDPIMGLVQVPCIERNAMGAVKALNAAALSLASDGKHLVSLDRALEVMKQTGLDMNQKYKETSTGGLALG